MARKASDVRRFNGLVYRRLSTHKTKSLAEKRAKAIRGLGDKARVAKVGSRWVVFMRGGDAPKQFGDRPKRRRRRFL